MTSIGDEDARLDCEVRIRLQDHHFHILPVHNIRLHRRYLHIQLLMNGNRKFITIPRNLYPTTHCWNITFRCLSTYPVHMCHRIKGMINVPEFRFVCAEAALYIACWLCCPPPKQSSLPLMVQVWERTVSFC